MKVKIDLWGDGKPKLAGGMYRFSLVIEDGLEVRGLRMSRDGQQLLMPTVPVSGKPYPIVVASPQLQAKILGLVRAALEPAR